MGFEDFDNWWAALSGVAESMGFELGLLCNSEDGCIHATFNKSEAKDGNT